MRLVDYQSPEQEILVRVLSKKCNTDAKWIALIIENFMYSYETEEYQREGQTYQGTYRTRFGVVDGVLRTWWSNGNLMQESMFKNGVQDGLKTVWNEQGEMIEQINYVGGKAQGELKQWHANGQLSLQSMLKDGYYDGEYKEWNDQGVLVFACVYQNKQRHGPCTHYSNEGTVEWHKFYFNDKNVPEWKWKLQALFSRLHKRLL